MNAIDRKLEQLEKKEANLIKKLDKIKTDLKKVQDEKESYMKDMLYKTFEKTEISLSEYIELIDLNFDDIISNNEVDKNDYMSNDK
ncbi:hypothetical protein [Ezakiella peruensis]|uniref:hypothetical protein n=1 Tax=Ezakiella peruensis TaxID=1464038 RepID=UPI000C1B03DC|nr:hypothetical protein [Ezakiella peruensis]